MQIDPARSLAQAIVEERWIEFALVKSGENARASGLRQGAFVHRDVARPIHFEGCFQEMGTMGKSAVRGSKKTLFKRDGETKIRACKRES